MEDSIEFGSTQVLRSARQVWRDGQLLAIGGRAFDVLLALIDQRHRVLTKEELLRSVWPGRVVEESNLAVQVVALRRSLGPGVIATVHGRGYRFVAPVAAARRPPSPATSGDLPRLFGRDSALHKLQQALEQWRLVTLTGPAGVGKSALAHAALQRLRDGPRRPQWADGLHRVDLANVGSPGQLAQAVRDALGLPVPDVAAAPCTAAGAVHLHGLVEQLAGLRALVLLDNAEHLQEAVATLVQQLQQLAPGLQVLVTSRQALALPDEQLLPLQGLESGFALQLFLDRARQVAPRDRIDAVGEQQALALCHALDGLPLAIELAAARLPLLGLQGLCDGLQHQLLALAEPGAPQRQRSLQAALAWSYRLLEPGEQALLQALSLLAGSFGLETVHAMSGALAADQAARWQAIEVFDGLVRKSLVQPDATQPQRWNLLRATRLFALQALQQGGAEPALRMRHALAVQRTLSDWDEAWCAGLRPEVQLHAEAAEHMDDLCNALDWACEQLRQPDLVAALLQAGARALRSHGRRARAGAWVVVALGVARQRPPPVAAPLWLALSFMAMPDPQAMQALQQGLMSAVSCFADAGDAGRAVQAAGAAALVSRRLADTATAAQALALGHALSRPTLPARVRAGLLTAHTILHDFHGMAGPLDDGLLKDVLHDLQAVGDAACRAGLLIRICLAERLLLRSRWQAARRLLQAVCDDAQGAGWGGAAVALAPLDTLAMAHLGCGDVQAAQGLLKQSMHAARWTQVWLELAGPLAWCLAAQGRHRAAALLVGAAQAHCRERDPVSDSVVQMALRKACQRVQAAQGKAALQRWLAEGDGLGAAGLHTLLDGRDGRFLP